MGAVYRGAVNGVVGTVVRHGDSGDGLVSRLGGGADGSRFANGLEGLGPTPHFAAQALGTGL